jgi:CheY-like chemotaxis protein
MNILILEDNEERIKWFGKVYYNQTLHISKDIKFAMKLAKQTEFDVIFLDHDLCEENLTSLNNGYEFVKQLVESGLQKQAVIYIHSMNPTGANIMLNLLKSQCYEAQWIPFYLLKLEDR